LRNCAAEGCILFVRSFGDNTLTGDKKSFEPTVNKILELFYPMKVLYIKGGTVKRFLPER